MAFPNTEYGAIRPRSAYCLPFKRSPDADLGKLCPAIGSTYRYISILLSLKSMLTLALPLLLLVIRLVE
jgi:hypothetical protein